MCYTIINLLTKSDLIDIIELNKKNNFTITDKELLALYNRHQDALNNNDFYEMAKIEYRLIDAGFQHEAKLLHEAEYRFLKEEILQYI